MFKYRMIYAITLVTSFIFFLIYSPWFSWYLFLTVLLLAPLDLLLSLPGLFTKSIEISAPEFLTANDFGELVLTSVLVKPFPVRCLYAKIKVIGDDFIKWCNVAVPMTDGSRTPGAYLYNDTGGNASVVIDTSQTGLTVFEIKKLRSVSLLGLFSVRIKNGSKVSVLIMPQAKKPVSTIELPRGLELRPKPGGGFSEEHDMRQYRPGDPVRSIHWKLSAKHDEIIVREPLIPPQQSRLIHVLQWRNAEERDMILSHLRWVSDYLLSRGLTYYIRFGSKLILEEITEERDLILFLRKILDYSVVLKPMHIQRITRFSWVYVIGGEDSKQA